VSAVQRRGEALSGEVLPAAGSAVERPYATQADVDRSLDFPAEVLATMKLGLSERTWESYREQWARYHRWCRDNKGRTPLPATKETLLSYLRSMAHDGPGGRGLAVSTIRLALSAIRHMHSFGDPAPDWVGGDKEITLWVRGYAKGRAGDPDLEPKRAAGARMDIMRALADTCDDTATGVRDRAILLLGYALAARRSELAALVERSLRYTVDGLEVRISRSKTDQLGAGVDVPVPANAARPQYCPVRAVQRWLPLRRAVGLQGGPLFLPVDRYGNVKPSKAPLSGTTFETVINRAVARAHAAAKAADDLRMMTLLEGRLTPHSVRRGFATDARASNWDIVDICRHGRWSTTSDSVHLYLEEAEKWRRHTEKPVLL